MPLIIVALGILALLFLIMGLKLNTFISRIVSAWHWHSGCRSIKLSAPSKQE